MDSKKPNKISEIVRLQRILKKWKKLATTPKPTTTSPTTVPAAPTANKSIKFLKKTLSFSDTTASSVSAISAGDAVPKGYLAVCVGKELKRFKIPTEYLAHQAFGILLREAEEEFGFQQEGVLKIPCDVSMFQKIVKMVEEKREVFFLHEFGFNLSDNSTGCCSSPDNSELTPLSHHHHPQLCR